MRVRFAFCRPNCTAVEQKRTLLASGFLGDSRWKPCHNHGHFRNGCPPRLPFLCHARQQGSKPGRSTRVSSSRPRSTAKLSCEYHGKTERERGVREGPTVVLFPGEKRRKKRRQMRGLVSSFHSHFTGSFRVRLMRGPSLRLEVTPTRFTPRCFAAASDAPNAHTRALCSPSAAQQPNANREESRIHVHSVQISPQTAR